MGPRRQGIYRHALGVFVSVHLVTSLTPTIHGVPARSAVNQVSSKRTYDRASTSTNNKPLGSLSPKACESLDGPSLQVDPLIEGIL